MPEAERRLIRQFLAGDEEALQEIDAWISQASWPFRRRLSENWEDILQDIRLELTRVLASGRFQGSSSLKTFIWRLSANACVDRVSAQRRIRFEELDKVVGEHPLDSTSEDAARVEDAFRNESRDLMLRVLAAMPEECKELWRMIFAGMSYAEMSRRLGHSEGALRVRVLRCRKKALSIRTRLIGDRLADTEMIVDQNLRNAREESKRSAQIRKELRLDRD